MSVHCAHCKQPIAGAASVSGSNVLHERCAEEFARSKTDRPWRCPKCKGSKKAAHPTKTRTEIVPLGRSETADCAYSGCRGCGMCGSKSMQVPVEVECDLCDGEGWTKTEAQPKIVTRQEGWEL